MDPSPNDRPVPHLDPASGTWSPTGSMATARGAHTATLLPAGRVLVAGGVGTSGYLASAEIYDPASGTWSPTGEHGHGALRPHGDPPARRKDPGGRGVRLLRLPGERRDRRTALRSGHRLLAKGAGEGTRTEPEDPGRRRKHWSHPPKDPDIAVAAGQALGTEPWTRPGTTSDAGIGEVQRSPETRVNDVSRHHIGAPGRNRTCARERRVQHLLKALDAETRFQAGVRAARRGWLPSPPSGDEPPSCKQSPVP